MSVQSENRYISIIDDIAFRCRWTRLIYSLRSAFLFIRHLCKFYCSCSLSGQSTRSELLAPVNSFKKFGPHEYYRIPPMRREMYHRRLGFAFGNIRNEPLLVPSLWLTRFLVQARYVARCDIHKFHSKRAISRIRSTRINDDLLT